jgi:uncharacterized LabA/DUF88 family protein
MKSLGIFVDITNQYYAALAYHRDKGGKIDYEKYIKVATDGYTLYRAFAYGVQMQTEAAGFVSILRILGYEPRYRTAVMIGDKPDIRKTDRNMMLAMDVWRTIGKLDVVKIGSNDPDLVPLIERIQELGVQVHVFSCNIPREIREVANRFIEIGEDVLLEAGNTHEIETSAK